ncbi:MAG: TIGR01777 family oxidoreductase [bacterium]|nr:TIGR01777 family oxidoreductase [bacterium]
MRVGVIGASGFIGGHLCAALRARGDEVITASARDPQAAAAAVAACDVVVNLAGEPIAQRWTPAVKQRLVTSRVDATSALLDAFASMAKRPHAYVSASAVGYYANSESATYDESSAPGSDFLGELCVAWERAANRAADLGMRVAIVRTGIVLGKDGGALKQMLPPFQLGAGGIIGNGRQWMSWIHIADLVAIYLAAIDGASGVMNGTAPAPVTNADFTKALGAVLHRPTLFPVPVFALRLLFGEGADILVNGQRVLPKRTQELGYRFRFTTVGDALADILTTKM